MPTTLKIPQRIERHCQPCQYHKCIGVFHVRSGNGGWREYACTHPDAWEPLPKSTDPNKAELIGRLRAFEKEGRCIGKTELQPDWCPLKRHAN